MSYGIYHFENRRIAKEFLGWSPSETESTSPISFMGFEIKTDSPQKGKTDQAEKWLSKGVPRSLPQFRKSAKAMFRILRRFQDLGFFFEIEGHGNEYFTTIYATADLERIICSGRGKTRQEATTKAVLDYLESYLVWQADKKANRL